MKNFFKVVFSRAVFTGAFIALQFAAVYLAITRFNEHFAIFYGVCLVLSAVVVVYLVSRDGNPAYKIAWIIPILALPVFGVLLYLVFGKNQLSLKEKARMSSVAEQYEKAMRSVPAAEPALPEHTDAKRVSDYLHRAAGAPVFHADASRPDTLLAAGLTHAHLVVLTFAHAQQALRIAQAIAEHRPALTLWVSCRSTTAADAFRAMPNVRVYQQSFAAAIGLAEQVMSTLGMSTELIEGHISAMRRRLDSSRFPGSSSS